MYPITFPGAVEIKKPTNMTDEECFSVWAQINKDESGQVESYTMCWKPSYEDLKALNRGEGVYIQISARRLPPHAVFTIDENGKCNDADS